MTSIGKIEQTSTAGEEEPADRVAEGSVTVADPPAGSRGKPPAPAGRGQLLARLSGPLKVVGSLVTLLAAAWGLYETVTRYFEQREREYEFKVSQEMIALSKQLGSDHPIDRGHAALLLSSFEEHAVPILLSNLDVVDDPELTGQLIESLQIVAIKRRVQKHPENVIDPLLRQIQVLLDKECRASPPSIEAMNNYLKALAAVTAEFRQPKIRQRVVEVLRLLAARVGSDACRIARPVDRELLRSKVESILDSLAQEGTD